MEDSKRTYLEPELQDPSSEGHREDIPGSKLQDPSSEGHREYMPGSKLQDPSSEALEDAG